MKWIVYSAEDKYVIDKYDSYRQAKKRKQFIVKHWDWPASVVGIEKVRDVKAWETFQNLLVDF